MTITKNQGVFAGMSGGNNFESFRSPQIVSFRDQLGFDIFVLTGVVDVEIYRESDEWVKEDLKLYLTIAEVEGNRFTMLDAAAHVTPSSFSIWGHSPITGIAVDEAYVPIFDYNRGRHPGEVIPVYARLALRGRGVWLSRVSYHVTVKGRYEVPVDGEAPAGMPPGLYPYHGDFPTPHPPMTKLEKHSDDKSI